ncbi:MAG: hypothetical protein JXA25_03575 [Anaerolineales bacterium]|nr:hypothetical protein [Anaerolineales bacterium]
MDLQRKRFDRLVFWMSVVIVFVMAFHFTLDTDTWWHLAAGERILETGEILRQDPFSLTRAGEAWEYPGWLAQICMTLVFHVGGLVALNGLTALLVSLTFLVIWFSLEGPALLRLSVLLLSAITSSVFWSARPQLFSFLFSSLFILILEKERKEQTRFLWFLPVLMAVWGNLHGGYVIGFMILGAYFASCIISSFQTLPSDRSLWKVHFRPMARLAVSGAAAVLTLVFNPDGLELLLYPFKTVEMAVLRSYIAEWQSPNFHLLANQPFLWILFLSCASLVFSKHKSRLSDLPVLFIFAYIAFLAARNISTFALVAAPILARHANSIFTAFPGMKRISKPLPPFLSRIFNAVLLVSMLLLGIVIRFEFLSERTIQEELSLELPVTAVDYLAEHKPDGNLFHSYNWGGYIIWRLHPTYLSFVDGRTDLFGDEILSRYLQIWSADRQALDLLATYGIDVVLVEAKAPLASLLECSQWELLYEDPQAVIYVRQDLDS